MPRSRPGLWAWLLLVLPACAPTEPTASLPPDDTPEQQDELPDLPDISDEVDSGPRDEVPELTVEVRHEGMWELSPAGGPWELLTGELVVSEVRSDVEVPHCEVVYGLTGTLVASDCPGCLVVAEVEHFVVEGAPEACLAPAPAQLELQVLGYARGEGALLREQVDGSWRFWYGAELIDDSLSFSWVTVAAAEGGDE